MTVYYGSEQFSFYSTIGKIELRLKDFGFIRIHKSYVVAMPCIQNFTFKELVLESGELLPVGRAYYPELKREMDVYVDMGAVV